MRSVAIDGPSGAGKSTISRRVASDIGFTYVDTGALYRTIGVYVLKNGELKLNDINIDIKYVDDMQRMFLNGEDVTEDIRRHEVSKIASDVSALPEVRAFLLEQQRDMARRYDVIMDGRDIGTVVLPNANVKIFLTASIEDRARRRFDELTAKGSQVEYETILNDVRQRDENDSTRAHAPLKKAEDAVCVDTTGNEWEDSVKIIKNIILEKLDVL